MRTILLLSIGPLLSGNQALQRKVLLSVNVLHLSKYPQNVSEVHPCFFRLVHCYQSSKALILDSNESLFQGYFQTALIRWKRAARVSGK